MARRLILILLVLLPGLSPTAQTNAPAIWAGAKAGPHAVGVARTTLSDLDVTYWYPAMSGGRPARLGDFSSRSPALLQLLVAGGLADSSARRYVESSMHARWDAPRKTAKFPLVLIGHGNQQDALDQAVLAEIVASHGFVVATIPSATIKSPMQSADDVGPVAQRQAEELLAAATELAVLGVADTTRMATIGHSFGARAALLAAMHDPRIRAVVSLDGGIGTATAQENFTKAPWFSREHGTAPILHFFETAESFMTPDFTLLRSLPAGELTLRELAGLRHAHFTTLGFQAAADAPLRRLTAMEPGGAASILAMVNELVRFLSAHVASGSQQAEWVALRESNFTVPAGQTPIALLRQMNVLVGSTDPFLRDSVAYEAAARWIYTTGALSASEQREMLALWTTNLQAGLGEQAGDAVFRRSFSALNLSIIAARENAAPFLSQEEFDGFLATMLDYLTRERDTRGYDASRGWIHAAAHTADVLKFLARSSKLTVPAQGRVLAAIDEKCRTFASVFQWGEDARLAQVIVSLARRADFDKAALDAWLAAIRARRTEVWAHAPAVDPSEFAKLQNVTLVLRAAYVTLSIEPVTPAAEPARAAILDTLRALR